MSTVADRVHQTVAPGRSLDDDVRAYFSGEPSLVADPYPLYDRLRSEQPVYSMGSQHVLTRHADIAAVLRDPRFSSNGNHGTRRRAAVDSLEEPERSHLRELLEFTGHWMLFSDPPDHTRLRGLVNRAFTPARVEQMRDRIERLTDELLDSAAGVHELDVIRVLAAPLPVIVIADLLGIPEADRAQVRAWSDQMALFFGNGFRNLADTRRAVADFRTYLAALIAQRRLDPCDDLISLLTTAQEDERSLSDEELFGTCVLLLFAGHETTTNLIGNGVLTLLRNPAERERLQADPALLPNAVEELLRYESPVQGMARIPTEPVTLSGVAIQPGETLLLLYGAANRDPEQFVEPHRLNIGRRDTHNLAFAHGPHFCLGAPLARLEGQIAIGRFAQRFPEAQLIQTEADWRPNALLRGLRSLPARLP